MPYYLFLLESNYEDIWNQLRVEWINVVSKNKGNWNRTKCCSSLMEKVSKFTSKHLQPYCINFMNIPNNLINLRTTPKEVPLTKK